MMRTFSPQWQPDEVAFARAMLRLTRNGSVPFDEAVARLQKQNLPTALEQSGFAVVVGAGVANAQLLIPKNPRRKSWLIANINNGSILFSLGPPAAAPTQGRLKFGGVVGATGFFAESNGTVSIDDIWVWSDSGTKAILGYEGSLAVH